MDTFDTQIGNTYNVSMAIAQQDKKIKELENTIGYSKTETDALLDAKADADNVYTKTETDALLDAKADADNVYTKTETDALLTTKIEIDLLWNNPNSNNEFDAQTITLLHNVNNYKFIIISVNHWYLDNGYLYDEFMYKPIVGKQNNIYIMENRSTIFSRQFQITNIGETIYFNNAIDGDGSTINNKTVIPIYVYGIK